MSVRTIDDRHVLLRGRTEELEAVEHPGADTSASEPRLGPGRWLLVEEDGDVRAVQLSRQITHLGRGFAATLQLEDAGVSRRHAIVVQRAGVVLMLDDRSANGTWVNGRRVHQTELHDGDVIALGRAVLVYRERPR